DHVRQPEPAEPAWHSLPDVAPSVAADAGAYLEPPGLGLAPHHLASVDADLPHAPCPGGTHPPARLRGRTATDHHHRPGPRGADAAADQQLPQRLPDAGDPL